MNRNKLKAYAPQARRDFIKAVTDRAAYYGLTQNKIEPITEQGDVAIIAGKAFPREVAAKRKRLEDRIRRQGFEQVMEAMAYTWFNRLVAIRFMEIHGYLDHGYRVLSHPEGDSTPEIVEHAEHVDLPGLDREKVIELKFEGAKESELYRMLLIAQCNALHKAMPFLFERIGDEKELLLPESLLHSDSVIRKLLNEIPEEDWKEVEIIGWLYQFYISEKKDQVIGKVVKSEDIPAATQLFTPNWIVKYMVQNTLGRQWMATYPNSLLKQQMEFYIEPAEQTPEVQQQLKAITPDSLNPEELTLLDPACGSGHILVEAYNLLRAIYQERGYRAKDIPRLILEKNLFGLEIDDRAAQLAAFALMMKARADDRRIFENGTQPRVLAIQESKGLDAKEITEALNAPILKAQLPPREFLLEEMEDARTPLFSRKTLSVKGDISQGDVAQLIELFEHGKTFGSLIRVPENLVAKLPAIALRVQDVLTHGDMLEQPAGNSLRPLVEQARILAGKYDAVVTNPPYMGGKFYNSRLKQFVNDEYKDVKGDLYACFMQRNLGLANPKGFVGMITIPNWMFLSIFEHLRHLLLTSHSIDTFIHNGRGIFGSDFGTCTFVVRKSYVPTYLATYRRLFDKQGSVASVEELRERFFDAAPFVVAQEEFLKIPGSPIAYWVSDRVREVFANTPPLSDFAELQPGLQTSDNSKFVRRWHEVSFADIGFGFSSSEAASASGKRWFPYNKGGDFRKWYGNHEHIVDWENDGARIKAHVNEKYPYLKGNIDYVVKDRGRFFLPSVTWSFVSSSFFGVRLSDSGFIFDVAGSSAFPNSGLTNALTGFLCSNMAFEFMKAINPTLNFQVGNVAALPFSPSVIRNIKPNIDDLVERAVKNARTDWNSFESSWDFQQSPLIGDELKAADVGSAYFNWESACNRRIADMKAIEEQNNRLLAEAYGLHDELSLEVPEEQITLYRPDRQEDIKRLVSYAIGCIMGRYSLGKPRLIYAHSGNQGFDPRKYVAFPADPDGIIPLTDTEWFEDDAANRAAEFIGVAWPQEHLEENLKFVAESLGPNRSESPRDTIRRYLASGFYKHHLSMYKKRPIYWLFSSGKLRAFQCLVYLHRYNEGTLSRMRMEYVIPLQGKISARIDQLKDDIHAATSTSYQKKLERERDKLVKQQTELQTFERNCANMPTSGSASTLTTA